MMRYVSRTESASGPADMESCRNGLDDSSSALRNWQRFSSLQELKFWPSGMAAAMSSWETALSWYSEFWRMSMVARWKPKMASLCLSGVMCSLMSWRHPVVSSVFSSSSRSASSSSGLWYPWPGLFCVSNSIPRMR